MPERCSAPGSGDGERQPRLPGADLSRRRQVSYDAVVLAGGAARRLGGVDKPGLSVGGRTLLDRALAACHDAGVTVVVGPRRPTVRPVVRTREDPPGGGPLAALEAGLRQVTAEWVLVLSADLPFLTSDMVHDLLTAASSPEAASSPKTASSAGVAPSAMAASSARGARSSTVRSTGGASPTRGPSPAADASPAAGPVGSTGSAGSAGLVGSAGSAGSASGGGAAGGSGVGEAALVGGDAAAGRGVPVDGDVPVDRGDPDQGGVSSGGGTPDGGPVDGAMLRDAGGRDQQLVAVYRTEALRRELALVHAEYGTLAGLPFRLVLAGLELRAVADRTVSAAFDCDTWEDLKGARARIREHGHVLDEWITAAKAELGIDVDVDTRALLDLARDAAHGVARPAAPLTTFLIGYAAGQQGADVAELSARVASLANRWAAETEPVSDGPTGSGSDLHGEGTRSGGAKSGGERNGGAQGGDGQNGGGHGGEKAKLTE